MKKLFIAFVLVALAVIIQSCGEKNEPDGSNSGNKPNKDGVVQTSGIVDLGLSVKWAARDLDKRTDDHFATSCTKEGSSFYYSSSAISGNLPESIGGTSFDNATSLLGEGWSTPSKADVEELFNKCRITYGVFEDAVGFIITGPNNNAIFMTDNIRWTCNRYYSTSMYTFSLENIDGNLYNGIYYSYGGSSFERFIRPVHK